MLATHKPASSGKGAQEKPQLGVLLMVAAVLLTVVFLGVMGHQYFAPSSPSESQILGMDKSSFPGWVNDAAMQCKGDMSKLSPDLQQKIAAQYKDGGRTELMASYALQTH